QPLWSTSSLILRCNCLLLSCLPLSVGPEAKNSYSPGSQASRSQVLSPSLGCLNACPVSLSPPTLPKTPGYLHKELFENSGSSRGHVQSANLRKSVFNAWILSW